MAGLQQYNFFPTDLFYPRPQPHQSPPKPAVLPLQNPNAEDLHPQPQQQQPARSMIKATPSTSAVVFSHKGQQSLGVVDNKVSKFSPRPLSWMDWAEDEEEQSSVAHTPSE